MPPQNKRTPSLGEIIRDAFTAMAHDLHVGLPAKVEAYYPEDGTVDVKPLIKKNYVNETGYTPIQVITKVPLQSLSMGEAHFSLPVKKGDEVWLVFGERSICQWFDSGTDSEPISPRHHDIQDAIAIPGVRSGRTPMERKGATDSIEMALGSTWIEITAEGKVKITNGSQDLVKILSDLIGTLKSAQVQTTDGPAPFSSGTISDLNGLKSDIGKLVG